MLLPCSTALTLNIQNFAGQGREKAVEKGREGRGEGGAWSKRLIWKT